MDASEDQTTRIVCLERPVVGLRAEVIWQTAQVRGAASQRNEGARACRHAVIGFFDDDIVFEPDCVARLWRALQSDASLGGVSAMITNQSYHSPGRISRFMFGLMAGQQKTSYAGQILGPGVTLLPEDRDDLPEVVPVEWLHTTCSLYRREALPDPMFPSHFTGYSMMEDLTLSVIVGRHWRLANARTARIYHDSQPGEHKDDAVAMSKMELVNRHYVMVSVLNRRSGRDYAKLVLWELFQTLVCAINNRGGIGFWRDLRGKMLGLCSVVHGRLRLGHQ